VGDAKGRLTPIEKKFVAAYVSTNDAQYSAAKAGYSRPATDAYRTLARPDVANAVAVGVRAGLDTCVQLALGRCEEILRDAKAPNKDVIAVSKVIFTQWSAHNGVETSGKDPSELSGDELQQRIARLQAEAAARATPIIEAEAREHHDTEDEDAFG
jgi:phage terminase small subunit